MTSTGSPNKATNNTTNIILHYMEGKGSRQNFDFANEEKKNRKKVEKDIEKLLEQGTHCSYLL